MRKLHTNGLSCVFANANNDLTPSPFRHCVAAL
jgi:hypothetical protein